MADKPRFLVSFWKEITNIMVPRTYAASKLFSEEYLSPANEAMLAALTLDMQSNPKLKTKLEEQIRRLPEYKHWVSPGQKTSLFEMANDIIRNEVSGDEHCFGFFVMSDKTDRLLGFAAYSENEKDRLIVTDIIIFRLDDKETLNMEDLFNLIEDLLKTHTEVWWSTDRLNSRGSQKYRSFIRRFKSSGFGVDIDPTMPGTHRLSDKQSNLMYFKVYNK